jgi:hypothetical protein
MPYTCYAVVGLGERWKWIVWVTCCALGHDHQIHDFAHERNIIAADSGKPRLHRRSVVLREGQIDWKPS